MITITVNANDNLIEVESDAIGNKLELKCSTPVETAEILNKIYDFIDGSPEFVSLVLINEDNRKQLGEWYVCY